MGKERKAVELQRATDSNDMKDFYNGLKEVWGPKKKGPVQRKSTDGMESFCDSKRVVSRWSEYFQKLLNVPGDIDHEALDNIPQRITRQALMISQLWIRWLEQSLAGKMAKHLEEMEFLQKYGSTEETNCSADCTN